MSPTPPHILSLPPDMREAYRAIRNAGAYCEVSARPIPSLASCVLGWRKARLQEAVDRLLGARYIRATADERVYVNEGPPPKTSAPRPILPTSEYEAWPPKLRGAWEALGAAEQRLLLRARFRWRGWPNPGVNPPKIPRSRDELYSAHVGLYAQELAYREWSECRGADGVVSVTAHTREAGTRSPLTPADVLTILGAHPDGLTVTELHDRVEGITRVTLEKWLKHAREYGRARWEPRRTAHVWFAVPTRSAQEAE